MIYGVFKILNKLNNKTYYGTSFISRGVSCRIKREQLVLTRNKHHNIELQRDWLELGKDNFEWCIINTFSNKKDCILFFKSLLIDFSSLYNIPELKEEQKQEAKKRAWQKFQRNNRKKRASVTRVYAKNNPEKIKSGNRSENTKKCKRNWFIKNPGYSKAKCAERRGRKVNATPNWVDKNKLKEIYLKCPKDMEVDHIIPLKNDNICGLHVPCNLQYLTPIDNIVKKNKFDYTYDNLGWKDKK